MTIDMAALNAGIQKTIKDVEQNLLDQFQKLAIQTDQTVVLATPRKTGRAAANWLPSLNVPISDQIDSTNRGQALNDGVSVASQAKLGDIIYISNNLPYIGRLNDGSSTQASAGFVQKATLAAQVSLKGSI